MTAILSTKYDSKKNEIAGYQIHIKFSDQCSELYHDRNNFNSKKLFHW
jgi:hypothetical protein